MSYNAEFTKSNLSLINLWGEENMSRQGIKKIYKKTRQTIKWTWEFQLMQMCGMLYLFRNLRM
jgi:hypothetical protein